MPKHARDDVPTDRQQTVTDPDRHDGHDRHDETRTVHAVDTGPTAHEKYGGMNWGAAFFGWLVAVALTVLLTGVIGAVVAAVDQNTSVTQDDAERAVGTIGLAAAVVLVVVLAIAYFTGGYVAGRMSRFDGGRQGLGVWFLGVLVTVVALALGVAFGQQYDVLDRVDLPRMPIPTDALGAGGVVTALVVLVVTALAAMLGGGIGRRYHAKVDRHLAA